MNPSPRSARADNASKPPPAATPTRPRASREFAAAGVDFAGRASVVAADHLDRAGKRARSVGDAAAAADDADLLEVLGS